ncbi:MAG: hypothetical protein ACK57U_15300, partial [Planctomycetota bacterium]
ADTSCPVSMIAAMRSLTGLSIADIKDRIATSQPLFEIVAFRNDWQETRYTLVRIAKQIEEGTLPLTVTEESNGFVTPVPLSMLKNMTQHFRQIELETQTDVALETGDIDDPRDFIPRDADWTQ